MNIAEDPSRQVTALIKYVRMSPKKVREVARVLQGKNASYALEILRYIPRKSARLIRDALASAIANAENNHGFSSGDLVIHRAVIEQGSAFRRFRPAPRGSAHPYKKRTSHIRIVLSSN